MTNIEPPPYETGALSEETTPSGFPTGYFVIKNCATGRLMDVATSSAADGTRVVLWTAKDNSLVLSMRGSAADNQIFFMDHTGALCSKASGHAIDVESGRLVLRHRKPFTLPFPNPDSHPLPRITYTASSKLIRATFGCDPNYPPPGAADPANSWRSVDYIVGAVALQRPRSFLENTMSVMSMIGATLAKPQALLANTPGSPVTATFGHDDSAADFALRDDEVMEEERTGEEGDVDDSTDSGRPVRVLELPIGWLEKGTGRLSDAALRRRQWEVIPLQSQRRRTEGA